MLYVHWINTLDEVGGKDVTDGPFESVQVTMGGYDRAATATLRDPNGDEIGRLEGGRGWVRAVDGSDWQDFVIDMSEESE